MHRPEQPDALGIGECLTLLRAASVGRLVFTRDALPAVQPVNFVLHEDDLLLWSGHDVPVRADRREIVAFEVDEFDGVTGKGWSVLVIGSVEPSAVPAVIGVGVLPAGVERFVRVHVRHLTGSRVRLPGGIGEPA